MAEDEYSIAADWLTAHPKCIPDAWAYATSGYAGIFYGDGLTEEEQDQEAFRQAACLFKNCGDGQANTSIGCLTQVAHNGCHVAETDELTAAIRADRDNIPMNGYHITVEDLPKFAEWRRRIDAELSKAKAQE